MSMLLFSFATLIGQSQPTGHQIRVVEGWKVQVDDRLLNSKNKGEGQLALKLIENQLFKVRFLMSADRLLRLQKVEIWLDLNNGSLRGPQYHPSNVWLSQHGYSPEMAKCVHIPFARYFNSTTFQFSQPLALLHELAHAYQNQVLGDGNQEIKAAFDKFSASKRYESVLRWGGQISKHYALTNPLEFFAEMTESYFGGNDFYPFNQGELKLAEPEIFELMRKIWGPIPREDLP